jgi:hypothetical protein
MSKVKMLGIMKRPLYQYVAALENSLLQALADDAAGLSPLGAAKDTPSLDERSETI